MTLGLGCHLVLVLLRTDTEIDRRRLELADQQA
jgi:hypothetical protein